MIFDLIYLTKETGELGRVPNLGITNIGGTAGPTFYVGGKALLFADGTATDGSNLSQLQITLQGAYNLSSPATIALDTGKPFTVQALNSKVFQINPDTGKVTITGDLEVLGASTVVEGVLANVDQVVIKPPVGTAPVLSIEPVAGVTMSTDLVRIRAANAAPPVFSIDQNGDTFIRRLSVGTTLNSVNFDQFYADFLAHQSPIGIKHGSDQIGITGPLPGLTGTNVQQVLESISQAITTVGDAIKTYEHIQSSALAIWSVVHSKNSVRPTVTIYDDSGYQVMPDEVIIIDPNTLEVRFNTPMTGKAIVLLF